MRGACNTSPATAPTAACRTTSTGRASPIRPRRPWSTCRSRRWANWLRRRSPQGLDPSTPAVAVARATRPDQAGARVDRCGVAASARCRAARRARHCDDRPRICLPGARHTRACPRRHRLIKRTARRSAIRRPGKTGQGRAYGTVRRRRTAGHRRRERDQAVP